MCVYYVHIVFFSVGVHRMLPFVRVVDHQLYLREWGGGLMVGGFEPKPKPIFTHGIPDKFEYQLLPEDWDQFRECVHSEQLVHCPLSVGELPSD